MERKKICMDETHSPHALQMLFPASSRLQRGVVLVPQFVHDKLPITGRLRPDLLLLLLLLLEPPTTAAKAAVDFES